MSAIATTTVASINDAHRKALACAGQAIEHARAAGILLLAVKADLRHGEFLPWIAKHCEFSERQAQRYMRVASGKAMTPAQICARVKTDTVSDLDKLIPHDFEPVPGRWMKALIDGRMYCIEPALEHPEYYFVSCLWLIGDEDAGSWCLTRPAHRAAIEFILKKEGVAEPATVAWYMGKSDGVREALEAQE